jgi:rhodanese-related sulfurtransferase
MIITVQDLKKRIEAGEKFTFIDVREPHEYEEFNLGATLIPLGTLPTELTNLEHLKNEEIIIHCRSGMRSANAQTFLIQNGFTNVKNVVGGVLAWQQM